MNKLSRRAFGRHLLSATAFPLVTIKETQSQKLPLPPTNIPDVIAGYALTEEDKVLAAKFFITHEKNMSSLREKDLPNSLAPDFIFASPRSHGETGLRTRRGDTRK